MEKVITSESLESTGYRCLFECVKQKGIEAVFNLFQDIRNLPSQEDMIRQLVLEYQNVLAIFHIRNKDLIDYFKNEEISLKTLNFKDENVYNTLCNLIKNRDLLDLYLDNARKLEELQVEEITFVKDLNCLPTKIYRTYNRITPLDNKFISVEKYYTDGKVIPRIREEEQEKYNSLEPLCSLPFTIDHKSNPSFVLNTEIKNGSENHRKIEIIDFGFDGSKLPTNEEVESYDVPKSLIFTNDKKM